MLERKVNASGNTKRELHDTLTKLLKGLNKRQGDHIRRRKNGFDVELERLIEKYREPSRFTTQGCFYIPDTVEKDTAECCVGDSWLQRSISATQFSGRQSSSNVCIGTKLRLTERSNLRQIAEQLPGFRELSFHMPFGQTVRALGYTLTLAQAEAMALHALTGDLPLSINTTDEPTYFFLDTGKDEDCIGILRPYEGKWNIIVKKIAGTGPIGPDDMTFVVRNLDERKLLAFANPQ
ncbi:MAG: hypothetical protein AB203_01300 [Parcubacteria bacterium C7867-008]|nr:MAG: hypothetical protein AB203_01300 [Parcubacteria bacterium C7867-008]